MSTSVVPPATAQLLRHERRGGAVNARSRGAVGAKRRGIDGAEHRSTLDGAMDGSVPTQTSIRMFSEPASINRVVQHMPLTVTSNGVSDRQGVA